MGNRKRHRSESEPLPPLPKYNMASDSIWRTNPNQEPAGSAGNVVGQSMNTTPSHSNSKDPFSSKRLTSIPDNNATLDARFSADSMMSPNAIDMDNIITPRMISPATATATTTTTTARTGAAVITASSAPGQNQLGTKTGTDADWSYFGFSQEDLRSPVPDGVGVGVGVGKTNRNKISLPKTPPPPNKQLNKNKITKDQEIHLLKEQLNKALKELNALKEKSKTTPISLQETPSFGSSTKKSINLNKKQKIISNEKPNDDEKENLSLNNNKKKGDGNNELQQQQLARYKHFITCPSCKKFDPKTPRNQVLIPCGHLVCGNCSNESQDKHRCPLCDAVIENQQLLLIG